MKRMLYILVTCFTILNLFGCSKTKIYTVNFMSNGGSEVKTKTVEGSSTLILIEPIKMGSTSLGWDTSDQYSNEFTMNTVVNDNVTLYAKWLKNKYHLMLKSNYSLDQTIEPFELLNVYDEQGLAHM